MDKEQMEELRAKFALAYEWRADEADIDWKPTRYKDRSSGEWKEGSKLAYLSWAVAWRKMKEIYPDANYRLVETVEGSPLWNVNGYGMLKCAVSACGVEHVETFPIMQGGQNESVKIEEVDGRDVNDSMQRGLTKAIARFGVGLYIFEGKLEAPKKAPSKPSDEKSQPKPTPTQPIHQEDPSAPLNENGIAFLDNMLKKAGINKLVFIEQNGFDPYENRGNAKKAIALLKPLTNNN